MKVELILSLGSNIEPRKLHLENAVRELSKIFEYNKISSLYESGAVDFIEQNDFYNICISYFTDTDDPFTILDKIQYIENKLGRVRDINKLKGPRVIDIDILLFGEYEIDSAKLIIPHSRMFGRRFVLEPLIEILHESSMFFLKYDLLYFLDKAKNQKIKRVGVFLS